MPRNKPPQRQVPEMPAGESIILVGQPGALRGELHLQNPGEQRLKFRGAQIQSLMDDRAPKALSIAHKLPSILVRPGEQRRIPLRLRLDSRTPPGEYRAEIKFEDQTLPVIMHVTEDVRIHISPSQVVLQNDSGAKVTKRIILRNQGNIPLTIDELAAAPLDDELLECRLLRAVTATIGDKEHSTLDDVLTEFARQSQVILKRSGILGVRNRTGRLVLQPGEVQPVEFEFRLPDTLDKRTRYRAVVPIYTSNLEVLIVPSFDVAKGQ